MKPMEDQVERKQCYRCKEILPITEFYLKKNNRRHSYCNKCRREVKTQWDSDNKEHNAQYRLVNYDHRVEYNRQYAKDNKEIIALKAKESYAANPKKYLAWGQTPQARIRQKEYRDTHKEQSRAYHRDYYKNNKGAAIANSLRNRLNRELGGKRRDKRLWELLGCDINFFMSYIEAKFSEGMNWDNRGFGKDKWNCDHIIPLAYFDLEDPDQLSRAMHYTNFQPLWTPDNISKNSKYNGERHYHKRK